MMERFVIVVNGLYLLAIITKGSILDVAAVLDPPLERSQNGTEIQWIICDTSVQLMHGGIHIKSEKSNYRFFWETANPLHSPSNVEIGKTNWNQEN